MTASINQHDAAASMFTKHQNKQERPTPVGLSMSSSQGCLQMSFDVGMDKEKMMDV